jgi:hypothetical protein
MTMPDAADIKYLRDFRARRDERDAVAPPSMPPPKRGKRGRYGDGAEPVDASRQARSRAAAARPGAVPASERGGRDGSALRRLGAPRPVAVRSGERGVPAQVGPVPVEAMLEDWVVEDRWWTGRPLRRRYFELVLVDGRNVVVFRDLVAGRWFAQRA